MIIHLVRPILFAALLLVSMAMATEILHPVKAPSSEFAFRGVFELDDDVYSGDLNVSTEIAASEWFSFYSDFSFRLLSYSYEYTSKGYLHNYANLHVHGLNETYLGLKLLPLFALGLNDADFVHLGINANWRIPPYYGSSKARFYRIETEPFVTFKPLKSLALGSAIHYDAFFEKNNYKPGDEFGLKFSAIWKPFWKEPLLSGWQLMGVFLLQQRVEESENRNLNERCRKMDDKYRGVKGLAEITRYFGFLKFPLGIGLNYEAHYGSLFGSEVGHRVGFAVKMYGF